MTSAVSASAASAEVGRCIAASSRDPVRAASGKPGQRGLRPARSGNRTGVTVEEQMEEIVRVLSDRGPLTGPELRDALRAGRWDALRARLALRRALRRGLVLRQGRRFASAMGEG
jgi:hypothetical protein